jgi:hypothetical protein
MTETYHLHTPHITRRAALLGTGALLLVHPARAAETLEGKTLDQRFDFLSTHGNSSCTKAFLDSIPSMPKGARIQGSCCSPMERTRYITQVNGLKKYQALADIPPDPYDLDAGLAAKMLSYYDLALTAEEQKAYDFAMVNSAEKGPCCCRCWHWKAYGGLGKLLIREHQFTGQQVTEIWDLSDGCGGS